LSVFAILPFKLSVILKALFSPTTPISL